MTRVVFIEETPDAKCELCNKIDELRPYGPNGENICYSCGMLDEEATAKQFLKNTLGIGLDS